MTEKVPWWKELKEGSRKRVVLIQIDIGGHSSWLYTVYDWNFQEAYLERERFCTSLEKKLSPLNYDLLYWAGDGGIFVGKLNASGHPVNVCEAADRIFKEFNEWKKNKNVDIRVSATSLELSIGPEPGFWCGPELNNFLKYEREIAFPNTFVITQELHASLVFEIEKKRFVRDESIRLPNSDLIIYFDSDHQYKLEESQLAFLPWLKKMIYEKKLPKGEKAELGLYRVGNCTILDGARLITGYGKIVLDPVAPIYDFSQVIDEQDREFWEKEKRNYKEQQVSGTSLQVEKFIGQISDDPHPRLSYRTIKYIEARSFNSISEHKPEARKRYRDRALNVLNNGGTKLPNILSTAVIAIIGSDKNDLKLVIANRKSRSGGFDKDSWSVSIGEQFMPIKGKRGNRELAADGTVINSAVRGMKEELLGEHYNGNMKLSIHSFCLDDHINDYFFVALADLRPLTFSQLVKFWNSAIDQAEHNAIAAFPICESYIFECLYLDRLPLKVWENIQNEGLVSFFPGLNKLPEHFHRWQPNSHVRLATALWYAKSFAQF